MGSAKIQGDLWGTRAREWAVYQEGSFRPLCEAALNAAHVGKGTAVLDVGCGAGLALSMAQALGAVVSGPFALSAPGALETLVGKAGLRPEAAQTVTTTMSFPDDATALRGLLASGVAERAIRNSGEAAVRNGIADPIGPFRKSDHSYVFKNEWHFLVSRV